MNNFQKWSGIEIVDKYPVRKFSALCVDKGIVLCSPDTGAFLTLRYKEDLENLKELLSKITVVESYSEVKE